MSDTQAVIERERSLSTFVGAASFGGAAIFIGSQVISRTSDASTAETSAESLALFQDDKGLLIGSQVAGSLAWFLFAAVLYLLFRSIEARSSQLNSSLIGLSILGPVMFAAASILSIFGLSSASDDFLAQDAPVVGGQKQLKAFEGVVAENPDSIDRVLILNDNNILEFITDGGAIESIQLADDAERERLETLVDDADIDLDDRDEGVAGELAASESLIETSSYALAQFMLLGAGLATVIILFYISRYAMRTGLLTTFAGTFGMAAAFGLILIPPLGPLLPFLWVNFVGLAWTGLGPIDQPPAWRSGKAEPWKPEHAEDADTRSEDDEEELADMDEFGGDSEGSDRPGRRDNRKKRKRKKRK